MTAAVDWKALHDKAIDVMGRAYSPYSRFPVGAAALTDDGRLVTGCNVENVSYGLGVCAEVTLTGMLHVSGGGRLRAFTCSDSSGAILMPCGRCRQVLLEHGGPELLINHWDGPRPLRELLPDYFGPDNLAAGQQAEPRITEG